jgi:CheY-like chemotaxis protein/HPt (histidine-containing phosphotransfer) domain-containing protein
METQAARSTTTGILIVLTGFVFCADLQFESGFAAWLPYFILSIPVSRLYSRRVFLFAVGGWSLLIMATLLAHIPAADLTTGLFNRILGIVGLWITAYLLYQHRQLERLRREGESRPLQAAPLLVASTSAEQGLHVLLAEDSPESQELMQFYFQGTPHQVDIVSDGEQAIEAFTTGRFDLVLIDLQMPGTDGFTATRAIRTWESAHQRPAVPILALTASAFRETEAQSLAAGCTGFLTKPISKPQLLAALNEYGSSAPAIDSTPREAKPSLDRAAHIDQEIRQRRPKFLEYRRKDLGAMRQAADQQDYEAIRIMGHRIKGLAGSYGFHDIGALGHQLEQAAQARDLAAIHHEIMKLAAILAQTERAA